MYIKETTKRLPQKLDVSPFISEIFETVEKIALSGMSILIVGERGTEKELLAKIVHLLSGRRNEKFVSLDCEQFMPEIAEKEIFGSENLKISGIKIYRGSLEKASGGTIFLDNFSSLPHELREKISYSFKNRHYRRIEGVDELRINVRLVTAINITKNDIKNKHVSKMDFFHSMYPISINLPPLRERHQDVIFIVNEVIRNSSIAKLKSIKGISNEVLKYFLNYNWPGNVEELQNMVHYILKTCRTKLVELSDVPQYILKYGLEESENIIRNKYKESFNYNAKN
jgi:DNA-binding NtrC family response regulator